MEKSKISEELKNAEWFNPELLSDEIFNNMKPQLIELPDANEERKLQAFKEYLKERTNQFLQKELLTVQNDFSLNGVEKTDLIAKINDATTKINQLSNK